MTCDNPLTNQFETRRYRPGDEHQILPVFNGVFCRNRTMGHWLWKFRDDPCGQYHIMLAMDGERLVSQYAAYPVRMAWNGKRINGQHICDSMTHPDYRGESLRRHGAFVRAANAFFDTFGGPAPDRVQLMYGFNTDRIQRLGRLLLKYTAVADVVQLAKPLEDRPASERRPPGALRYAVRSSPRLPDAIDNLWRAAGRDRGLEVIRDGAYLRWRYEQCPDSDYTFWVLSSRLTHSLQGLIVTSTEDTVGRLVDFVWHRNGRGVRHLLARIEDAFAAAGIRRIETWAPDHHPMFPHLVQCGYRREPEPRSLAVICRSFTSDIGVPDLGPLFSYTMGDSDLF